MYNPLRLPAVIKGKFHPGGVSTTKLTYGALQIRSYHNSVIVLFAGGKRKPENEVSICQYTDNFITIVFQVSILAPISTHIAESFAFFTVCKLFRDMRD